MPELTAEQRKNIRTALKVAQRKGASPKEQKALVEAMGVESTYRDLNYGDRDSLGILQQRNNGAWGAAKESVATDVGQFLDVAKAKNATGQYGSAGKLAQAVQVSGFPDRYDQRSGEAEQILAQYDKAGQGAPSKRVKAPAGQVTAQTPAVPGVDNSALRRQLVGQFLQQGGVQNSNAVLGLAAQYGQAQDTPGTPAAYTSTSGSATKAPKAKVSNGSGALSALKWAESKVNAPGSRETSENHGKLADYANSRFGMSGQAWCAMFTSLAVTKGGAPKSARTASVAEVRRKALAGDGYQRGTIDPARAKPGDLVLFDDRHIGMVKGIKDGQLVYVGGNQSDSVTQAQTGTSGVTVVRPKYGRKK